MDFLRGRFVRQTIVDAFRPDGLFRNGSNTCRHKALKVCHATQRQLLRRGFSCRDQDLWSGRIGHDSDIGPNSVRGALPANSASRPIDGSSHLERAPNRVRDFKVSFMPGASQ